VDTAGGMDDTQECLAGVIRDLVAEYASLESLRAAVGNDHHRVAIAIRQHLTVRGEWPERGVARAADLEGDPVLVDWLVVGDLLESGFCQLVLRVRANDERLPRYRPGHAYQRHAALVG